MEVITLLSDTGADLYLSVLLRMNGQIER